MGRYLLVTTLTAVTVLLSALGTHFVRRFALAHGVLDVPNERSAHLVPTPRGGGLAVVIAVTLAWFTLVVLGEIQPAMLLVLVGSWAVAVVGYCDDRYQLSAKVRLLVHVAAALWALAWLGGFPPLAFGDQLVALGGLGWMLGLVGIVWTLNLFNFMDGIDGIAAAEAIFVCAAGALLTGGGLSSPFTVSLMLAAGCTGFLFWNWPPAKIFMGDIGSGFLGFVVAVLAIDAAQQNPAALFIWLILGGTFFADATVTLIRRMVRGEAIYKPHRSHAYQILARRWNSHRAVTLAVMGLNVVILLPMAWLAIVRPSWSAAIAFVTVAALGAVVWSLGAGSEESASIQP